jgi:hypothetical protein
MKIKFNGNENWSSIRIQSLFQLESTLGSVFVRDDEYIDIQNIIYDRNDEKYVIYYAVCKD